MSYQNRFKPADDLISHLNKFVPSIADPFIESRYVGFVAVASVTVYELAIKDIYIEFARTKHRVFGDYTSNQFERLNGRIRLSNLKETVNKFGKKYHDRFNKKLSLLDDRYLRSQGSRVTVIYDNLIQWRHQFAHLGNINTTATYLEITSNYFVGKEVIHCLNEIMRR